MLLVTLRWKRIGKNEAERPRKAKMTKAELLAARKQCKAIFWPTVGPTVATNVHRQRGRDREKGEGRGGERKRGCNGKN